MPADIYTEDLVNEICALFAEGKSMRSICAIEGMPSKQTLFNWFRTREGFLDQYTRAKEESAEAFSEDILDIADDSTNDYITKQNNDGEEYEVVNHENIQRSKLRIDSRKWLASKLKPKKYGDKIQTEHSGNVGLTDLSDVGLAERLAEIRAEKAKISDK